MAGGAPIKYSEEWMKKEAKIFLDWMRKPESIYFKAFAFERGYSAQRLVEFAENCKEFSEAMKIANEWQEQKLVTCALWKKTDSAMTKIVLANKHGWREHLERKEDPAQNCGDSGLVNG